ncbi:MAG: prohibitin family protein, partial [Oscillospiraceae bacterium]|nr:prohibitin family protein [Oscillospiraceae bacterium]
MAVRTINVNGADPKKVLRWVIFGAVALVLIIIAANCFASVPAGFTGVKITYGAASDNTVQAGLRFKAPFVTQFVLVDNRTKILESDCSAASKDLQTITSKVAVNYRVEVANSASLYKTVGIGYESVLIAPAIQESMKAVVSKFSAEEIITRRQEVSAQVKDTLSEKISQYGLVIDIFNIVNLEFSAEFNKAIEAKQTAQQDALKAEQDLNRIKIEAQQKLEQAKAEAEAVKAKADAEAYAIQKLQEQLAQD